MTLPEARALARQLADAASDEVTTDWAAGIAVLARLDGRSWLLVDQGARASTYGDGTPVSGVRGWMSTTLAEPSGFVAVVTSLHVDGRFRERAVGVLGAMPGEVAAPALAVRLLDHVPAVRERAWESLRDLLRADTAEAVFDVLLAGVNRQHSPAALDRASGALLDDVPLSDLVAQLAQSDRRRVRRWAFQLGHERDLFTIEQLVLAAQDDADQWIRASCAEWLMQAPDPGVMARLLGARSVEARLVGLTRVPEAILGDSALGSLLLDRAPRVREQARWRARRRGWDIPAFYRRALADENASPRVLVACLDGLADLGGEQDVEAAVSALRHSSGRVRAAAVVTVEARASSAEAVELLTPALVDPSARVSTAAARALARLGVPPAAAEPAWSSDMPSGRRAAWRLARAAGGWHRVEADLRGAADPDPHLSGLGRTGLRNWLDVSAATTWEPLPEGQRARIASWLDRAGLGQDQQQVLAFHAGIKLAGADREPRSDGDVSVTVPARRGRWLRLLRRT
ncbi:HEAT repeat domain-containing protein [Nocardioides mangrovi]|uniref:HEAT repeat domain-containing protein n=1 Tax=Nocardioides mangrovi TaxID=2874580 RepID=A0ABS7U8Y8_9ACTN|nr:HEAT repeat domain-containing protein [Nocardioides mangrovi]MBZ5737188.1 HEAT repeat domain-containing protein [Nocardioides mangrovi]